MPVMKTMPARIPLLTLLFLALSASLATAADAPKTGYSGLPVPRFVNLKGDTTNARVGPSLDYPVRIVYQRRGLPVRVVAETPDNAWRKVVDFEGESLWIHHSQLTSSGVVMVTTDRALLHARPAEAGPVRAALERGVLAEAEKCEDGWCQLHVGNYRGWVEKSALWGVD